MAEKLLVSEYVFYGKGDGERFRGMYIIDDTSEAREELIESIYYDDAYDSEEDFIDGEINTFSYGKHGGDWDDPTGGYITVSTKEDAINIIRERAEDEINRIEQLFENSK